MLNHCLKHHNRWQAQLLEKRVVLHFRIFYLQGINIVKKHVKTTKEKKGGIISKESFIHISNLKLVDEKAKTKKTEAKK